MPSVLRLFRSDIEAELRTVIKLAPPSLGAVISYHFGWADTTGRERPGALGKLVRPTLCLLSCRAVGGDTRAAMPAAAALELIHNFSLIHDDIEDGSDERHHQLTVWKVWGEPQAINVGDAVMALTQLAVLRLEQTGVPHEKVVRAVGLLAKACLELCEGQQLDIAYESRLDVGIDDYRDMILKKTAVLVATATCLGALVGSDDQALEMHLYSVGKELGLAYQIRDDILGIWGAEEATGKPVGGDIEKRKKSLPIIYALEEAASQDKEELIRLYQQPAIVGDDVGKVVAILGRTGAREFAQALAERHYDKAMTLLSNIGSEPAQYKELRELAEFLVRRDY